MPTLTKTQRELLQRLAASEKPMLWIQANGWVALEKKGLVKADYGDGPDSNKLVCKLTPAGRAALASTEER